MNHSISFICSAFDNVDGWNSVSTHFLAASICAPWLEAHAKLPAKMNAKVTIHSVMDRTSNHRLVNFRIVSSSPIGVVVAESLTAGQKQTTLAIKPVSLSQSGAKALIRGGNQQGGWPPGLFTPSA
ncbi:MAG: hypothetical protein QNJ61_00175 [Desulfobacterales bacterium]|nr:hypothetical protein [Desulfobacterales bacterium]